MEGAATDKDRESPEEPVLLLSEEVVAPGYGVAQGLLARWHIAGPACQELEPLGKSCQQGLRGEQGDAGGSQFNRQRQPIKAAT